MLEAHLGTTGLDLAIFEPLPGRASLVGRIEGSDPSAPTLMLMGHTDVVPVTADHWSRDPFGGELIDGEVWGRGAVDMLNLTSSMAVAFRHLASTGFTPRGTLVYLAVADEEALGQHGAQWLLDNEPDAVACDYLVTEFGGLRTATASGTKVSVNVAEKGTHWVQLKISGTPGHASRPMRTDNALVKAAEVVRRIAEFRPPTEIHQVWRRYVEAMDFDPLLAEALVDPERVWQTCPDLPEIFLARQAHACTHATFAPTIMHGGTKVNVIPDEVVLEIDVRTLPEQTATDIEALLDDAIGPDLRPSVSVVGTATDLSTASPLDTPLWDSLARAVTRIAPDTSLAPGLMAGATDARFFRRRGVTAYGAGLFSERISANQFAGMFHGNDERIDTESLRLTTELWVELAHDLLG